MKEHEKTGRYLMTVKETAVYFHIGEKKLRRIVSDNPLAEFIIMNGNRVMIKRKLFEEFIDKTNSI